MSDLPLHYRIKDYLDEDGIHVQLEKWHAIKETPKGYWVSTRSYLANWSGKFKLKTSRTLKFVLKNSAKRYCYPTIQEAMDSYAIRKYRQVQKLTLQLDQAQKVSENIEILKTKTLSDFAEVSNFHGINLGHTEQTSKVIWDY